MQKPGKTGMINSAASNGNSAILYYVTEKNNWISGHPGKGQFKKMKKNYPPVMPADGSLKYFV